MPLTLEDIARLSGVSRSTVSRVINHDPNVSETTRQRVQEILDQISFQPNMAAKGLVSGKTNIIGVVIPTKRRKKFLAILISPCCFKEFRHHAMP